jgi:hypothetical protein
MGKTFIKYNEVEIRNCLIRRFDQEPVYDDSGTDLLYFKFSISVEGIVYTQKSPTWSQDLGVWVQGGNAVSTTSATAHYKDFRRNIAAPRGNFLMVMGADSDGTNGETMLDVKAASAQDLGNVTGYDMNNGPRGSIRIIRATGDDVFRVQADFEVCTLECGYSEGNKSNVLSNRWTCADDIDENFYTTRTFSGRLRLANSLINPHGFRSLVIPTLQPGMKRKSVRVTSSSDGLTLDYTVTDDEAAFSPPEPATSWSYSHTESMSENGATQTGHMEIRLSGDRRVNKKELLAVAVQIMRHKILSIGIVNAGNYTVKSFSATDSSGSDKQNTVVVNCTVQHVWGGIKQNFIMAFGRWGKPIDGTVIDAYDNDLSPPLPGGTEGNISAAAALSAYLQSPCNPDHAINFQTDNSGTDIAGGSPGIVVDVEVRPSDSDVDEIPGHLSDSHVNEGIYTYYQGDYNYQTNEMVTDLPLADTEVSGSSSRPDSISLSQLARPTGRLTVRISAERQLAMPVLPAPKEWVDVRGITMTPLNHKIVPSSTDVDQLGEPVYRVNAEYTFALSRAPEAEEEQEFNIGEVPWLKGEIGKTPDGFLNGSYGNE